MVYIESYENLANAIILQAVEDYKKAIKEVYSLQTKKEEVKREIARKGIEFKNMRLYTEQELEKEYTNRLHGKQVEATTIERFFKSDWYMMLSKTNGERILNAIQKQIKQKLGISCDLV